MAVKKASKEGLIKTNVVARKVCPCGRELAFIREIVGDESIIGSHICECGREYRVDLRPARVDFTGVAKKKSQSGADWCPRKGKKA